MSGDAGQPLVLLRLRLPKELSGKRVQDRLHRASKNVLMSIAVGMVHGELQRG
jgi:hypothetical protein